MKTLFLLAVCLTSFSVSAVASKLDCAEDENTFARYCYDAKQIRANGDLRSAQLYTGGPKSLSDSGFLSVVNCKLGYLEMRDQKGVAFARSVPEKKHIKDYVRFICAETSAKLDKNLR